MTIYTYSADELAGMVANFDDKRELGNVIVLGSTHAEASEMLEYIADRLGDRVVRQRRTNGNARLILRHGVAVHACIPRTAHGRVARLLAALTTVSAEDTYKASLVTHSAVNGSIVRVSHPDALPESAAAVAPAEQAGAAAEASENPATPD